MTDDVRWLSDEEERLWRGWLQLGSLLPAALHRELQADAGLSYPDFDVLVRLTDRAEGRVRSSELAEDLHWERSRLSHHVSRMERRGLVAREVCADDKRGAFVVITDDGRTAIEAAAPGHLRAVRRLVLDALSDEELAVLATVVEKVLGRLAPAEAQEPSAPS